MSENIFNREVVIKIALDSYPYKAVFDEEEFKKDLYRFFIVRRMSRRFFKTGSINEKLILNSIIICLNIFGIKTSNLIWKMICTDDEFSVIMSFLIFLNSLNPSVSYIKHNQVVLDLLKDIEHRYTISPNQ